MKIKVTFVTNSSSASFTILKMNLTEIQMAMIYDHIEVAYAVNPDGVTEKGVYVHHIKNKQYPSAHFDEWTITENESEIHGYTTMDNFNMHWFLKEVVRVKEEHIDYDDGY